MKARFFYSAYAGSMTERKEGDYVERGDPESLAVALVENCKALERKNEDVQTLADELKRRLKVGHQALLAALPYVSAFKEHEQIKNQVMEALRETEVGLQYSIWRKSERYGYGDIVKHCGQLWMYNSYTAEKADAPGTDSTNVWMPYFHPRHKEIKMKEHIHAKLLVAVAAGKTIQELDCVGGETFWRDIPAETALLCLSPGKPLKIQLRVKPPCVTINDVEIVAPSTQTLNGNEVRLNFESRKDARAAFNAIGSSLEGFRSIDPMKDYEE